MPMRPSALAVLLVLAALVGTAGLATAHATAFTPDGSIKFVFGNLGEPIYTFQKTGLDLGIFDNATGEPVTGLAGGAGAEPTIAVSLRYLNQELPLPLTEQHGKAGWYTSPYMLTRPGLYPIHVKGTVNGIAVDQTIQPRHAIESVEEIMWPDKVATQSELASRVHELEAQVAELQSQLAGIRSNTDKNSGPPTAVEPRGAPGLDASLVALAAVATAGFMMRRRLAR